MDQDDSVVETVEQESADTPASTDATAQNASAPEDVGSGEDTGLKSDPLGSSLDAALGDDDDEPTSADSPVPFDFNRPHSVSRTFEQQLRNMCENFAKAATITFTNVFRVNTLLEFKGLTLVSCKDYLAEMPNPTCISNVTLAPLKGQALLHLDLELCFAMLKKLMGGAAETEETLREFTDIERGIFLNIVLKLLGNLREASARLVDMKPEFVSMENNPAYVSGVTMGDSLVTLEFTFKLDAVEGPLEFGIPMAAFEPVRELFDPEERRELRSLEELRQDRNQILDLVQGTHSEIVVKLCEMGTTLEAIMQLQEGDLLHLSQPVDALLLVEVQDKPMFLAEAGRVRQNRAVRLTERLNEE